VRFLAGAPNTPVAAFAGEFILRSPLAEAVTASDNLCMDDLSFGWAKKKPDEARRPIG